KVIGGQHHTACVNTGTKLGSIDCNLNQFRTAGRNFTLHGFPTEPVTADGTKARFEQIHPAFAPSGDPQVAVPIELTADTHVFTTGRMGELGQYSVGSGIYEVDHIR